MNEIKQAINHLTMLRKLDSEEKKGIYDTAITALERQQADMWIPVSKETNPKTDDAYQVTFEENGKTYVERFYYSTFSGWLMPVEWQNEGNIDKLIAWKSLSEPYKEGR